MKPNTPKSREKREEQTAVVSRDGRAKPTGWWPSVWNWGTSRREVMRQREIRDLHGDYSEQTGAFFG